MSTAAPQNPDHLPTPPLNIEADVLVKLAYAQMQSPRKPEMELTEAWLVANGF